MSEKSMKGGCMCGAVRYRLEQESDWVVFCHCDSCRRHTGAPVVVFLTFTPDQVSWTSGSRAHYESSPGRFRGFCRDCGTPLTWETSTAEREWIAIYVGTLDSPERFPPTEHVFCDEGLPWLGIEDGLKKYRGSKFI